MQSKPGKQEKGNSDRPPTKESPNSAQRAGAIQSLEQVKLNIGDSLQLQFQPESISSRCVVILIGYFVDRSVIVSTPMLNGIDMMIREGQIFIVRLFSGKSAYAFTAEAIKITNTPFPHMYLSYPKEVRGLVLRGSSRAPANIICHASVDGAGEFECVARDISAGGALVAVHDKIGEVGTKLCLKLNVHVNGTGHLLDLCCLIRSVNTTRPSSNDAPIILHGLSFENVSSQDSLIISAMLYQNLVNEKYDD